MLVNPLNLLIKPASQWPLLAQQSNNESLRNLFFPFLLAIIPCASFYYGTTEIGWTVLDGDPIRLTASSALKISLCFYVVIIVSIIKLGFAINWMSDTYGEEDTPFKKLGVPKSTAIAALTATPLFVVSILGFYPLLWLDLLLGIFAACWSLYLLYQGIPQVLGIPTEQGFLYASSVVVVCLVLVIAIMCGAIIIAELGFSPVFTD